MKLKLLKLALQEHDYPLAAHALVYGMIMAKVQENQKNGKKGSPQEQSKRS